VSTLLLDACVELYALAERRGDTTLPHPANDPRLWSSRTQDAWDNLREQIISAGGGDKLSKLLVELENWEREIFAR